MGRKLRQFAVTAAGAAVTAVGIALMVLPGPGLLVVVIGLAILATEYVWARRLLERAKQGAWEAQVAAVSRPWRTAGTLAFAAGMIGLGITVILVERIPYAGPGTAGALILGGVIVCTTTVVSIRHVNEQRKKSAAARANPHTSPPAGEVAEGGAD